MGWLVGASDFQRASLDYLSTDGKQSGYMAINSEGLQGCKLILYLRVTFKFNGCLLVVYSCAHMILVIFACIDLLTFYVLAYAQVLCTHMILVIFTRNDLLIFYVLAPDEIYCTHIILVIFARNDLLTFYVLVFLEDN